MLMRVIMIASLSIIPSVLLWFSLSCPFLLLLLLIHHYFYHYNHHYYQEGPYHPYHSYCHITLSLLDYNLYHYIITIIISMVKTMVTEITPSNPSSGCNKGSCNRSKADVNKISKQCKGLWISALTQVFVGSELANIPFLQFYNRKGKRSKYNELYCCYKINCEIKPTCCSWGYQMTKELHNKHELINIVIISSFSCFANNTTYTRKPKKSYFVYAQKRIFLFSTQTLTRHSDYNKVYQLVHLLPLFPWPIFRLFIVSVNQHGFSKTFIA